MAWSRAKKEVASFSRPQRMMNIYEVRPNKGLIVGRSAGILTDDLFLLSVLSLQL